MAKIKITKNKKPINSKSLDKVGNMVAEGTDTNPYSYGMFDKSTMNTAFPNYGAMNPNWSMGLNYNYNPEEVINPLTASFNNDYSSNNVASNLTGSLPNTLQKYSTSASAPKTTPEGSPESGNNIGGGIMGALRFAPAVGSLMNVLDKDKAEVTKLSRVGAPDKMNPELLSTTQFDPLFNSEYNKAVNNIISTSGGSGAAARSNIQAASLGNARNKAQAIADLTKYNAQVKDNAERFNLSREDAVNMANTQIANQESVYNEQNRAAARNQQYQDWMNLFDSLGGIGKESFLANQVGAAQGYKPNTLTGEVKYRG